MQRLRVEQDRGSSERRTLPGSRRGRAAPGHVDEPLAPVYPPEAAARELEGYVTLSYTIAERGSVEDVRVLESGSELFEPAAISALRKYKYAPRLVAEPNVTTVIRFGSEE